MAALVRSPALPLTSQVTNSGWSTSQDGSRLATAGPDGTKVWDAASGQPIRTLPDADLRQAVGFSPDGRLLATAGGSDGTIRIWESGTGTQQSALAFTTSSASSAVLHLTFSPDGRRLAATILDGGVPDQPVPASQAEGTVIVWDLTAGKQQLTLRQGHPGAIFDAAFSPDGQLLASLAEDGTVRLDVVPIGDLITLAHQRVMRGFNRR